MPKAQVKGTKGRVIRQAKRPEDIPLGTPRSRKHATAMFQKALQKRGWKVKDDGFVLGKHMIKFAESNWVLTTDGKEVFTSPYGGGSIKRVEAALSQK